MSEASPLLGDAEESELVGRRGGLVVAVATSVVVCIAGDDDELVVTTTAEGLVSTTVVLVGGSVPSGRGAWTGDCGSAVEEGLGTPATGYRRRFNTEAGDDSQPKPRQT